MIKITIPTWLYRDETSSAIQHTHVETGNLDVNELLNGGAYWIEEDSVPVKKKKTLVISDCSAENWFRHVEPADLLAVFRVLLGAGFQIYTWSSKQGAAISWPDRVVHFLEERGVRQSIDPNIEKEIETYFAKCFHIAKDDLEILDYFGLRALYHDAMKDSQTEPRTEFLPHQIDIVDLVHSCFGNSLDLLSSLKQSKTRGSALKVWNMAGYAYGFCSFFVENNRDFFENLEELNISHSSVNPDFVRAVLMATKKLRKIKSVGYNHIDELLDLEWLDENEVVFKNLEEWDLEPQRINGSDEHDDVWRTLFARTPNLKKLTWDWDWHWDGNDENPFAWLQDRLKTIESFVALGSRFGEEGFGLEGASMLKALKVSVALKEDGWIVPAVIDNAKLVSWIEKNKAVFEKLEVLEFDAVNIDINVLQSILECAPELKVLRLVNCVELEWYEFSEWLNKNKNLFKKIEELHFEMCGIDARSVLACLAHTTQIKVLALRALSEPVLITSGWLVNNKNALSNLEKLSMDQVSILGKDFFAILTRAENIHTVNLCTIGHMKALGMTVLLPNLKNIKKLIIDVKIDNLSAELLKDFYNELLLLLAGATKIREIKLPEFVVIDSGWLVKQPTFVQRIRLKVCKTDPRHFDKSIHAWLGLETKVIIQAGNKRSPKISRGIESSYEVDHDTTNMNRATNVEKIFYAPPGGSDPEVREYRHNVFNYLDRDTLIFSNQGDIDFEDRPIVLSTTDTYSFINDIQRADHHSQHWYARVELTESSDWRRLPSLSDQDNIKLLHISGINPQSIIIKYSKRDDFYYIRCAQETGQPFFVDYILAVSNIYLLSDVDSLNKLPFEIRCLIQKYRSFPVPQEGQGELDLSAFQDPTPKDIVQAMIDQKKGACRHRAKAFIFEIGQKCFGQYRTRYVTNDCHAFVTVFYQGQWIKCDFGGHPAKLKIVNKVMSTSIPQVVLSGSLMHQIKQKNIKESELNPLFVTWKDKDIMQEASLKEFLENRLAESGNSLIKLPDFDSKAMHAFQLLLQEHCKNTNRSVYSIHEPAEVRCSANFVKRLNEYDNTGEKCKGPGGALHDFLTTNYVGKSAPVLIVNFDNFKDNDIVRLNSLIADDLDCRSADGTFIPKDMLVMGLFNPKKLGAYQGADFLGRFNKKSVCRFSVDQVLEESKNLTNFLAPLSSFKEDEPEVSVTINLYHSHHWQQMLLGTWVLHGSKLIFEEGVLTRELKKGSKNIRRIDFKNAPVDRDDFCLYWQEALLNRKIKVLGTEFELASDLKLSNSEFNAFDEYRDNIHWLNIPEMMNSTFEVFSLSPSTAEKFVGHYEYHKGEFYKQPGLLEANKNKSIILYLTRELGANRWAQLLDQAKLQGVKLNIVAPPSIKLPTGLQLKAPDWVSISEEIARTAQVIISNNINEVVEYYQSALGDNRALVINISECEAQELLYSCSVQFLEDGINFKFKEKIGIVLEKLERGQLVILTGHFPPAMIDALSSLCLPKSHLIANLKRKEFKANQLLLITDKNQNFDFIETAMHKSLKEPEPVNLYGLTHLNPKDSSLPSGPLDLSQEASDAFEAHRLAQVEAALNRAPYVFISGVTGVGKTSFIQEKYNVHMGLSQLIAWAEDKSDNKIKILFSDEVTLGTSHFTQFEGLYQDPPHIVIKGILYKLDNKHKLIVAGNPLSYGGERQLPSFFKRHGNAIVFTPLSAAYMYHHVLKPVLGDNLPMASIFLKVYTYVCSLSKDTVLMTPRDLQMMSMIVAANKRADVLKVAYTIAKNGVPQNKLEEFNVWFAGECGQIPAPVEPRQAIENSLKNLLTVRAYKQQTRRIGGLSGAIIEGKPAVGKSFYVKDALKRLGCLDFLHMPVSMKSSEKKALLLKAFDEGKIVVIDEMNSCPMMEQLLNALLMGRDLAGNLPTVPGFTIIATQNPITMSGRRETGLALERRFLKHEMPPQTHAEMVSILVENKGVRRDTAEKWVGEYDQALAYAIEHHVEPEPTFREVLNSIPYISRMEGKKRERENKVFELDDSGVECGFWSEGVFSYFNSKKSVNQLPPQPSPIPAHRESAHRC